MRFLIFVALAVSAASLVGCSSSDEHGTNDSKFFSDLAAAQAKIKNGTAPAAPKGGVHSLGAAMAQIKAAKGAEGASSPAPGNPGPQ